MKPSPNRVISTSRLQSAEKGDYFPTDMAAVIELARILNVEEGTPLLDPSCGKGRALAHLGMTWNSPTYGNEIDRERYEDAKKQLTKVTRGAAETLEVKAGCWPFVFCNPPYNQAENGKRLEIEHTKQCLEWVRNSGVVVFVLPKNILARQDFWYPFFYRSIDEFYVYEMVGQDFERFHQYVVVGFTPTWTSSYRYGAVTKAQAQAEEFQKDEPTCSPITKATPLKHRILRGRIDPTQMIMRNRMPRLGEHLAALETKYPDPFASTKYKGIHAAKAELVHQQAVAPCRATHVIQLAAAGAITGATIPLNGVEYYWVGSWRRFETTNIQVDEEGNERSVTTEDIAYVLRGMNLETGHYIEIDSENDQEAYSKLLNDHTADLMDAVDKANPPRYQMNYEQYLPYFKHIHSPRELPGQPDGPFTAQKHVGAAILDLFDDPEGNEHAIIVGEMGTGKTMTSMMTQAIQSGMIDLIIDPAKYEMLKDMAANKLNTQHVPWPTIVVMCPAIVAPKWCHEADAILRDVPGFKSFHIGREYKQSVVYPHQPRNVREGLMIIDYRGLQAKMATGYNNIGKVHHARGAYDEALEGYQKGLRMAAQTGDQAKMANGYNNIATIYYARGMYDEALDGYQKGLALAEQIDDQATMAGGYNGIGAVYLARGMYDEALEWLHKGLVLAEQIGDQAKMAAGTITDVERKKFYHLQGVLVEGEYSRKKRRQLENDRITGKYERGKPTLAKGSSCTFFGKRHFDEHPKGETRTTRYVERFGQTICPTYPSHRITVRRPIKDLQEAMAYQGPKLLAIDFQRAKNGAPWDHVALPKKMTVSFKVKHESQDWTGKKIVTWVDVTKEMEVWHCPRCGGALLDEETGKPWTRGKKRENEFCTDTQKRVRRVCNNEVPVWDKATKEWTVEPCHAPLYQSSGFLKGGRWPAALYLKQFHGQQYHAILDEAHNTKSGNTNVGAASHHLISGSLHTIAMTGTIFNGYARSLFYLLYRLDTTFRNMYEHDDVEQFVQTHGLVETITVTPKKDRRRTSAYGYSTNQNTHTNEIPGASPELVAMMAPFSVWLRLADVGIELPERTEMIVPVKMGADLSGYYNQIEDLRGVAVQAFREGDRGPMSKWFWLALGGLDRPDSEELAGLGGVLGCAMPEDGYAKDKQLVNLVKSQMNRGRGVAIFVEQVNRRDPRDRIRALLARNSIHADVLDRSTCAPDERMIAIRGWIAEAEKRKAVPVLITNGALVKEGVDLLEFPTIVEVGQQFNVTQLRQRAARSHRIGQTEPVEIYYLYYSGTYQEDALSLIAAKLFAMDSLDGDIPEGLSKFKSSENNFMMALMKSAEAVEGRAKLSDLMQTAVFDVPVDLIIHTDEAPQPKTSTTVLATPDLPATPVAYVEIKNKKNAAVVQMGFVF